MLISKEMLPDASWESLREGICCVGGRSRVIVPGFLSWHLFPSGGKGRGTAPEEEKDCRPGLLVISCFQQLCPFHPGCGGWHLS